MTYQETLDYLFNALPMYQHIGKAAYKADLNNTLRLCEHLGNPHHSFKSIHIAGTNGKGSSSHALSSVLQEAGYKVGLYTSPHLKSFTERIKVNGREIPEENVISFVDDHRSFLEKLQPSFFEMTVGMAFHHFAEEAVDYAVVEVGMGGRLDSTNILVPELSLITNIGYDHVKILGNTLPEIAREKAGIIKPGIPVVISETHPETKGVFEEIAREKNSRLYFADQNFRIQALDANPGSRDRPFLAEGSREKKVFRLDLTGDYQRKNLAGILQAVSVLKELGLDIPDEPLHAGLRQIVKNTGIKGRWQKLGERPWVYCDTGHNAEGLELVLVQISNTPHRNLFIILGVSGDKDLGPVLEILPKEAQYVFCEAKIPRALPAKALLQEAKKFGLNGEVVPDVNEALKKVLRSAQEEDFVFVGGSTFVVAELENL